MSDPVAGEWPSRLVLGVIRLYRAAVSPWLPPACRFVPTCSEYAAEVVRANGVIRGVPRACARLLRCHPLHPGGIDLPD